VTLRLFSSESVTEGHPDKVCDRISDSILDGILEQDPDARVAVETMVTTGLVHVAGEVTTSGYVEIPQIIRDEVSRIGYTSSDIGFDGHSCGVSVSIGQQSPDIAGGVGEALEARTGGARDAFDRQGAGDQGMMFGFACSETPELMPLPISLANRLARRLTYVGREGILDYLRPDGKTQVTVEYDENGKPVRVDTIVISSQHSERVELETIRSGIIEQVIKPVIPAEWIDGETVIHVNPTGRFVIGGPHGDSGLTGRKIIVDTYGGYARHGGGAFSGKDPTKVDRSASYAARYVAKNIVAAGLAAKCEVELAYAIGIACPVSVMADTFGTGVIDDCALSGIISEVFDLTPAGIIAQLDLKRPIYQDLAAFGHIGRTDIDLTWERTDRVEALRKAAGLEL